MGGGFWGMRRSSGERRHLTKLPSHRRRSRASTQLPPGKPSNCPGEAAQPASPARSPVSRPRHSTSPSCPPGPEFGPLTGGGRAAIAERQLHA